MNGLFFFLFFFNSYLSFYHHFLIFLSRFAAYDDYQVQFRETQKKMKVRKEEAKKLAEVARERRGFFILFVLFLIS